MNTLKAYDAHSILGIGYGTGAGLNQFNLDGIKDIYGVDG